MHGSKAGPHQGQARGGESGLLDLLKLWVGWVVAAGVTRWVHTSGGSMVGDISQVHGQITFRQSHGGRVLNPGAGRPPQTPNHGD